MTTANTAPDTMIDATFNFVSASGAPVQALGPYPTSAWKARAFGTVVSLRPSLANCRAWRRDPPQRSDMQPGSLATLTRELQDYAQACRKARWDGTCMESSTRPLVVFGALQDALGWVAHKLATHDETLTDQDLADWNEIALNALWLTECQHNVPPAVDHDLARDGYTTAEFIAEHVHAAAEMLLGLYRRLPTNGPEAYAVGLAIGDAEEALADVLGTIREGVQFALGMRRAAEVAPEGAALWAQLMTGPAFEHYGNDKGRF